MQIVIFGAGKRVKLTIEYCNNNNIEIVAIADNFKTGVIDKRYEIVTIYEALEKHFDYIYITNREPKQISDMVAQLLSLGVEEKKILAIQYNPDLLIEIMAIGSTTNEDDTRVKWLADFAKYCVDEKIGGNVAECGVLEGNFAYYINQYFCDRVCYLFDTFDGFCKQDVEYERYILKDENFLNSDFNNDKYFGGSPDMEIVKRKLKYIDQVRFFKGYFPESARLVDDTFCFVNLDMDLYKPQFAGLRFFYDKMEIGGVILLHDYFCENLPGVRKAVNDFEIEIGRRLSKTPIGDGKSIAIIK